MPSLDALIRNRHILITGGSSGIGLALGTAFANLGGTIHIAARRQKALERALDVIEVASGPEVTPTAHRCDVTDPAQVDALFDALADTGATPTIVVTAAGMTIPARFTDAPPEHFDQMMQANLGGTVSVARRAIPPMVEAGKGYFLAVGSLASIIPVFGMSAYCASKFAVRGFVESLRAEMKPHSIGVSLLCPPDTDTPMLEAERPLRPPETDALSSSAQILSAEVVAAEAIRGILKGRALIIPGSTARRTALAQRLAPKLVESISDGIVKKARRGDPA